MPKFPPPTRTPWLKITREPIQLIALSDFYHRRIHWIGGARRSYKCLGEHCPLCAKGNLPDERFTALCEQLPEKNPYFVDLTSRHRAHLEQAAKWRAERTPGAKPEDVSLSGLRFWVHKRHNGKHAPIEIELDGFVPVQEIDISRFIETLSADPREIGGLNL
jgi:hypothetical protein